MTWAGTGVLWTIAGGVPHSLGIMGEAQAAEDAKGLTFLQLSDSHVGFDKPANPNALGTLEEAVAKVNALPKKPAFAIHTGDISHLSLESQFDDADRVISQTRLDVHYVPGEHDFLDPDMKFYKERYGRGTKGSGWYSFDANGVHFIGLINVVDLKAGGLGNLGADQLEWLEDDLKSRSASTPIVVFGHIPLWTVYPEWGWGTARRRPGAVLSQALRLGDRAQRPHPPSDAEGGRQHHLPYRALDRFSATGARHRAVARTHEGSRRPAAHHARHRRRHVQAERTAARHHRQSAQGMRSVMSLSSTARSAMVAAALGAATATTLAAVVLPVWAQNAAPAGAVSIDNFTFNPTPLTVKAGTTVTWTNKDDIPHGIASSTNAFAKSRALDTDQSFSFTFTTPGTYQYFCYVHPHMVGSVVVEASTGSNAPQ